MSKLVTNGSKYSDEERTQAAIHYAVTGSLVKTEEATGIPDSTIGTWKKQDWWDDLVVSVRSEIRALAEQCKELSRTMRDHRVVSVQKDGSVQAESNG